LQTQTPIRSSKDFLTYAAFITAVILGGFNSISIHFVVQELPPFWGATLRFAPASALLFLIVLVRRLPLPKGRALLGAVIFGVLQFGVAFGLMFWSLQTISPGFSQVLLALSPLLTLLFAVLHRQETFRWQALGGSLLALGGIALIFADHLSIKVSVLPLVAIILAAASFAESTVIVKGFPKSHPITTNAVGMAAGAVVVFGLSWFWQEPHPLPSLPITWLSIAYLVIFGSSIVFTLMLFVLKRWTASATSYALVLLPFITILVSSLIGEETLTPAFLVGGAVILLGVYIGALHKPKPCKDQEGLPLRTQAECE